MAGVKISQLAQVPALQDPDVGVVVHNGVTYKFSMEQLGDYLTFGLACAVATTGSNLNATYNNGSSGIGATLTNAGALTAFALDGVSPAQNARVLIKDQSLSYQNGIYNLTNVGSGSVAWVLTRATDYQTSGDIFPGNFITVMGGTVNSLTQWIQTASPVNIGTDNILFQSNIVAGTGITKTNNVLSTTLSLAAGTYTPTLTNVANLSASTAYSCQYLQVGNVVTVSGQADTTPTASSTLTKLGISLPIVSTFASANACAGAANSSSIVSESAAILGDTVNERAQMTWITTTTSNHPMYFTFTYRTTN